MKSSGLEVLSTAITIFFVVIIILSVFVFFFCCDIQNRLFFFVKIKYFYIFSIENIQNKMYSYVYPFMDVDLAVILRVNMSEVGGGGKF